MEKQTQKVYKDMITGVTERYQYVQPGIHRILGEVEYLLRMISETEEEKCEGLIDKPWDYLVQYKIDEVVIPFSEISPLSICLAFKMLIWSRFHPDRLLSFLSQGGGGESCKMLSFVPLPHGKKVIGSWLDTGLSYEKHQELFDSLLLTNQTCRELIFPKARYPSTRVNMSNASIRTLLQKARMGRSYEKNIPFLVTEILEHLSVWTTGIFPFYSRRRAGDDHAELLAVLIIRNKEAYFYLKNQDVYYEINRMI